MRKRGRAAQHEMIIKEIEQGKYELLRIKNIMLNLGLRKGLAHVLFLLFTKLFYDRRYEFVLTKNKLTRCRNINNLIVRKFNSFDSISQRDLVTLKKEMVFSTIIDVQHHLEKNNRTLWIAYINNNPAALMWSRPTDEQNAWIMQIETFVKYRGRGCFTYLLYFVCNKLFYENIKFIGNTVHVLNKFSIVGMKKVGFEVCGEKFYNKFGKILERYFLNVSN